MNSIKIFGAGSIGNHLAHAARTLGWDVVVCDVDPAALRRMREDIYPGRYGSWDAAIRQFHNTDAPVGGFDLIFVGTPPDSHMTLALQAITERPKAVLIEKPLCGPELEDADRVATGMRQAGIAAFVGYDHVVGLASGKVAELLASAAIGNILTLDVEFREHWAGIFKAHPWLRSPSDTYLGFWKRGGGAAGEHSHAINLWQHFSHLLGRGRVLTVSATLDYVEKDGAAYDRLAVLNLTTETGFIGRVVQDVVTLPIRKRATITGEGGVIEWVAGYNPAGDAVLLHRAGKETEVYQFPKKRPDDFIAELKHILEFKEKPEASPISLERGMDSMLVIAAAHESSRQERTIKIDYSKGYARRALQPSTSDR
jgi:predicted dehydrogenase